MGRNSDKRKIKNMENIIPKQALKLINPDTGAGSQNVTITSASSEAYAVRLA